MKALRAALNNLSLSAICMLSSSLAYATTDGPDRFAVRDVQANDTLALRVQPSASARKVTALPPKTRGIENLGCVDKKTGRNASDASGAEVWCKVRIGSLIGWASVRYLREDTEVLKPYSVSGAPSGPGQFIATSTMIDKKSAGDNRWKTLTQTVISQSDTSAEPNEVIVRGNLVDCRPERSEVIRLSGDDPEYAIQIIDKQDLEFKPALSDFDEYNLWWKTCRNILSKYRWP